MGLIDTLTVYIWNWFVYLNASGSMFGCWFLGGWGLFWDNDDGLMINTCMELYGGSQVTFPVEYSLN